MGFWGLYFEPIITLAFFIFLRIFLKRFIPAAADYILGIDLIIFLSIGVLYVTLFRTISITPNISFKQYKTLSIFSQIKPIDIFLALTILEQWIISSLLIIIISIMIIFTYQYYYVNNIGVVLVSFTLLTIFCFSAGLIINSIILKFPFLKPGLSVLSKSCFIYISCIFPFAYCSSSF